MRELFPIFQMEQAAAPVQTLPLYQDVAMDYQLGRPVFAGGEPVLVTGLEAVKGWAWRALMTARYRYSCFTWDYGCEAESLIGKAFTAQVKESEAVRYVREALAPNPYITDVRQVDVSFQGTKLTISCQVSTIYGEAEVTAYV